MTSYKSGYYDKKLFLKPVLAWRTTTRCRVKEPVDKQCAVIAPVIAEPPRQTAGQGTLARQREVFTGSLWVHRYRTTRAAMPTVSAISDLPPALQA
jgi:hypothetical protein